MKILWVSTFGGNYNSSAIKGTGGWVAPLETAVKNFASNIELGIVFTDPTNSEPRRDGNVTYFPVYVPKIGNVSKFVKRLTKAENREEEDIVRRMAAVAAEFKPDIIHIWGCEIYYSRIVNYTDIPCVVHIQGLASSCINVYMPNCFSVEDLKKADGWVNTYLLRRGNYQRYKEFLLKAQNEYFLSKKIRFWIGRTQWDRDSVYSLNPNARYYHGEELMRDDFFSGQWQFHYTNHLVIQSTVSDSWYKGFDIVLRTAKVLKDNDVNFEWNICGISKKSTMVHHMENKLSLTADKLNINLLGSHPANIIKDKLLNCDVYVHPSHIENSSNAICEAMLLGIPVVAEYTGGTPTILKDDSGLLVQPYDSYCLASAILKLRDKDIASELSLKSRTIAHKRHNTKDVVENLVCIYNNILDSI